MPEIVQKTAELLFGAFRMNGNAIRSVQDPASDLICLGETINERTKADSLHNATYADEACGYHV